MLIILFLIVVHKILYAKGPVVTAHTYPYQPNGNGLKGARATPNNTRPQRRTAARARCVGGYRTGGGGRGSMTA